MSERTNGPLALDELKRLIRSAGYQMYGTRAQEVLLAERVRDNLILDSGISVSPDPLTIHVTVRAQMFHFQGQSLDECRAFAERLGQAFLALGYERKGAQEVTIPDMNNAGVALDTVCEVSLEKPLPSPKDIPGAIQRALALPRTSAELEGNS